LETNKAQIVASVTVRFSGGSSSDTAALAKLANRAMKLQINIQDGDVMVSVGDTIVNVTPQTWELLAEVR
jgi:uncharacterized protein YaeQ